MSRRERHQAIINLVNDKSGCSVEDLVAEFEVSDTTIRRDLQTLEEQNLIKRTHGGAMPVVDRGKPYENRKTYNRERKASIGARAVEEIFPKQIVLFDSGSTAHEVVKQIPEGRSFTPITPMPAIARELSRKGLEPALTGGTYREETHSCVGPWAEKYIKQLNADLLVLCADGIDESGLTVRNIEQSYLKELMIDRSNRVVLVADNSKFDSSHAYQFADYEAVDIFITNDTTPVHIRSVMTTAEIELIENTHS